MAGVIAKFIAAFPDTGAAVKFDSEGSGKVTLQFDEQQYPEIIKALRLGKEKALTVTIETE